MIIQNTVILFLALLCLGSSKACYQQLASNSNRFLQQSAPPIHNFESGKARLVNANTPSKRYNPFDIPLTVPIAAHYDATLSIINIQGFSSSEGMDFFITTGKTNTYLKAVFVIEQTTKWVSTTISYIISARSDFAVGIFTANSAALMQGNQNETVKIHHHLPHLFEQSEKFIMAMPFISGVRTFDQQLKFSFLKAVYDSSTNILQLEISVLFLEFPLQSLYVSYIIFNLISELDVTDLEDPFIEPSNTHFFKGISQIQSKPSELFRRSQEQQKSEISILASGSASSLSTAEDPFSNQNGEQGFTTPSQQQAFEMIFQINGVIIQTQQMLDFLNPSPPPSTESFNGASIMGSRLPLPMKEDSEILECISRLSCQSRGGVMVYSQNNIYQISSLCYVCKSNTIFDEQKGECVCREGFTKKDNQCVSICPEKAVYHPPLKKCFCIHRHMLLDQNTNQCSCKDKYFLYNGNCRTCHEHASFNGQKCICSEGYTGDGFLCDPTFPPQECISNAFYDQQKGECACREGFKKDEDQCVRICSGKGVYHPQANQCYCPYPNMVLDVQTNDCICQEGYDDQDGECKTCDRNASRVGENCICQPGYRGDGYDCIPTFAPPLIPALFMPSGST